MIVAYDLETLQQALLELAQEGKRVALVPTMGALHAGHASLITLAQENADAVVVSIFVNPLQFSPAEDFSQYPRTLDDDLLFAGKAGVDIVYVPAIADMYPEGFTTSVSAGETSKILCGKFRPGHFDGVATVVTKLLLRVMPHIAVFGIKDYQQFRVIQRIVYDLDIPAEMIAAPTLREKDGLALSSRNRYLSAGERKVAPLLYQTLTEVAQQLKHSTAADALAKGITDLTAGGYKVEYLEIFEQRLMVAAWLGKTRLIDNVAVE